MPSLAPVLPPPGPRAVRSDGLEARSRLLHAALALFASQGFAKTSTREIAQAAGTNIASISYYFGDKAGLYAATFNEPMGGNAADLAALLDAEDTDIRRALGLFFDAYVAPLKDGDVARQCMRLHMRELIEPSGERPDDNGVHEMRGPHEAMVRMLCRHLSIARPDDDVHRLALTLVGMAIQLFVMQDVIASLRPALLERPEAIDTWSVRLSDQAMALIDAEAVRRRAASGARS